MPISMAFNEIQVDRDGYISKESWLMKSPLKRVFAYVLAALPFYCCFPMD